MSVFVSVPSLDGHVDGVVTWIVVDVWRAVVGPRSDGAVPSPKSHVYSVTGPRTILLVKSTVSGSVPDYRVRREVDQRAGRRADGHGDERVLGLGVGATRIGRGQLDVEHTCLALGPAAVVGDGMRARGIGRREACGRVRSRRGARVEVPVPLGGCVRRRIGEGHRRGRPQPLTGDARKSASGAGVIGSAAARDAADDPVPDGIRGACARRDRVAEDLGDDRRDQAELAIDLDGHVLPEADVRSVLG